MKIVDGLKVFSVTAASLAMTFAPPLLQASHPLDMSATAKSVDVPQIVVRDVAINSAGQLDGIVINTAGTPVANSVVLIQQAGKQITEVTTDVSGKFVVAGLPGGVYKISSGTGSDVYRLWAPNTSPPAASDGVLIIDSGDVVRGQMTATEFITSEAVIIGAVAATAIAIPIAVHNSKRDSSPAS